MTAPVNIERPDIFQREMEQISLKIENEIAKGDKANFRALEELVKKVLIVIMRLNGKADSEFVQDSIVEIKIKAQQIQATFNGWLSLTFTVVSASLSIGAGGLGLFGGITGAAGDGLKGITDGLSATSQGAQGLTSIFNAKSEGNRTYYQVELEQIKNKSGDRTQSANENRQRQSQLEQTAASGERLFNESFSVMCK